MVGGCVRDILLGLNPEDYDIATSARPKETLSLFPHADKIGLRFGVLKVEKNGHYFQIATFRRDDAQSDGRRPRRIFFSDLQGDSTRRDFTINAIYLDPVKDEFIDPQNGIADLEAKLLCIIGEPVRRLREDHLRILRAVRFAARFDLRIEPASFSALIKCAPLVEKLSPDRIRNEITRVFLEGNRVFTLELLHKTGILPILWDIFSGEDDDFYRQVVESMSQAAEASPVGVWSAFFRPWMKNLKDADDAVENAMMRLNFPRRFKREVKKSLLNDSE